MVCLLTCGCGQRDKPLGIENVLLIVVDTLRADHLRCYGYPRETSPSIDALARDGARFAQASAAWPETSQSLAALWSGMYARSTGVHKTPMAVSRELVMLPELLQKAGMQTAAVVTNPVLSAELNYDQGFDRYVEVWQGGNSASWLAEQWLKEMRDPSRGFLLWVHYLEPHAPYQPAPAYHEMFVGDPFYDPDVTVTVRNDEEMWNAVGGFPGFSRLEAHDELHYYIAQYDAEIRAVDAEIAKLLETVEQLGLTDETLIIVTADHGESLGEHSYYWHGLLPYDPGVRVPLIMSHPGLSPALVEQVVSLVDLAPTMLDVLGQPIPDHYQGVSLRPLLEDPSRPLERTYVFSESGHSFEAPQRAIRDNAYKLIYVPDRHEQTLMQGGPYELYHFLSDPGEKRNRINEGEEVSELLKEELRRWLESGEAPPAQASGEISEDVRQQIESLGYVN